MNIEPIPDGTTRGWKCELNGVETPINHLRLHSVYGELTYGLRPEGYDGWAYEEANNGGAVTILYAFTDSKELLIGLILEDRPNMGDAPVLCVMGGMADATDKDAHHTQRREAREETGASTTTARKLRGAPTNSNRLFFTADPSKDAGVKVFALEYPIESLQHSLSCWKIRPEYSKDKGEEGREIIFLPWKEAVRKTVDGIARAAIAQLLAEIF